MGVAMSEWPDNVDRAVYPADTPPAGPEGHCGWCRADHGKNHTNECPVFKGRLYDAAPRQWLPIETYVEGWHALLFFPNGEKGIGGIEAATSYRDDDGVIRHGWTHGGPNAGADWDFVEPPTHWMPLPDPPERAGA